MLLNEMRLLFKYMHLDLQKEKKKIASCSISGRLEVQLED